MRRKTLAVAVAVGALAAGIAVSVMLDRESGDDSSGVGVTNTRAPEEISSYWTEERKNEATGG